MNKKAIAACLVIAHSFIYSMEFEKNTALEEKRILLLKTNNIDILSKEAIIPPREPQAYLVMIYNNALLLQEPEVTKLDQTIEKLYPLIARGHFKPSKDITHKLVAECTDRHPEFNEKLKSKKTFEQEHPTLPEQLKAVNGEIEKLGNNDLKELMHAYVTFAYTDVNTPGNTKAANTIDTLAKKHAIWASYNYHEPCFFNINFLAGPTLKLKRKHLPYL